MTLDSRYMVAPVRKALQVLDELAATDRPVTLSEIAARAALPKTTAYRYLYTLRAGGFVQMDAENDTYTIGSRVALAAAQTISSTVLKKAAQPLMRRLQRRFNETVNLGVRSGPDIIYLDMVGSTRSLRMQATIGNSDPIHATAIGKAILSGLSPEERDAALPRRLALVTPHTLIDRQELARNLEEARVRGYATDLEENELGARCVAVSIPAGPDGPSRAAISISGPVQRITLDNLQVMGRVLAREMSAFWSRR
jgi:DNA-binding IclR family transcriptional regulator